jgi:DNA modification methylase
MTPYYQDDACTIYHGDCREILPTLGRFDLLLTDPPYGLGIGKKGAVGSNTTTKWKHGMKEWGVQEWDAEAPSTKEILAFVSIAKTSIIWGGNYFEMPPSPCWFVWDKKQRDFTFADAELAWTNFSKAVRIKGISRGELTAEGRFHPTCKPLALMQWCLSFAPDAETILDPFMGSGTTLVAAKLEGRRAVGIELEERYCEIAANRLSQGVLF